MNLQRATDLIWDLAYEKNIGILEAVHYMKENLQNLSEWERDAFYCFYYEASEMFAPVQNEYQTYSEHSE